MRYLLLLSIFFLSSAFAEVYEDYEPSEQFIQLTVVAVEPNYLDDYLVNLKKTWVRAMEIQKELGYVVDYGVYTSDNANSPNVWLTITYENMAAMQPSEEQYNKVNSELEKRYEETEDQLNTIAKSYEEIRKMVDNQIINRVKFK
jgi:phage-related tail protein